MPKSSVTPLKVFLSPDIPAEARTWRNNPEIWQWCRQNTLIDANQQTAWLGRISKDPTIKMFGVGLANEEKSVPVGVCGLTSIDRLNQSAEFSLYIAPQFQHKGVGRGALHALLTHGFKDHNLHRIWGEVFGDNPALKMFKSLGMQVEGVLRDAYFRSGKFTHATRVSILRSEWNV